LSGLPLRKKALEILAQLLHHKEKNHTTRYLCLIMKLKQLFLCLIQFENYSQQHNKRKSVSLHSIQKV